MNWLDGLVKQHEELESPLSFWRWSGLAAISAVVKDNVWLHRQIHNLYPNIYVMLHAESGLKKGPPISMAKQMVAKVNNTRIISGRSSIQGILKDMGTAKTDPKSGKITGDSTAFICSNELTSSLVGDKVAADILTDLYDRSYNIGHWRSLLKMESFDLKNPTITMLVATNEAHSEDFFGRKDVQGGYFARTFIVYESKRNKVNSLLAPLANPPDYDTSSEYLKKLGGLKGRFTPLVALERSEDYPHGQSFNGRKIYFSSAGMVYEDWYNQFTKDNDEAEIRDETGTLNRFGDSVLKVAMLLSLADHTELIINESQMNEAIGLCRNLIGNVRRATLGTRGLSASADLKVKILRELLNRDDHKISQDMLMKKLIMDYTSPAELTEIMQSFEGSGMITIRSIGNKVIFEMPIDKVNELKRHFEGRIG